MTTPVVGDAIRRGAKPRRRAMSAALAATAALLATGGTAHAGPPGTWTQVTGVGGPDPNTLRVGLARTPDGVLHVLWARQATILHSTISPNGASVAGPGTVFTGGDGANPATALVAAPDGSLRAFFSSVNVFDSAMATATSPDGAAWTVGGPVSRTGPTHHPVYAASGIGATVAPDGTFSSIWGDSTPQGGGFHVGLDPNVEDGAIPGGMQTDPNVAADAATGSVFAAWNLLDTPGVDAMAINPAGAPVTLPGSVAQLQHRVGIAGRIGAAGVFVAYARGSNPFSARPAVYRVDTGQARTLSSKQAEDISIAPAPGGRLWVFWQKSGRVFATRSNTAATAWGRIVSVRAAKRSTTIYDVAGEGSTGPLDVLALTDTGAGAIADWHQRILPALTLTARKGKGGKVSFRATDAGTPVFGVKIRVGGGGSKTTGSSGRVTFTLKPGTHGATARKTGYTAHAIRVRVR